MKHIVIAFILICTQYGTNAQGSEEIFTIYLVRHAEKAISADNPKDPPLTQCGQQRAGSLAGFLGKVDLDAIYSTDYIRTKSTAQPTANANGIAIKFYDPRDLEGFAKQLIDGKEDVLVVGHSNTTGTLAGLLAGEEVGSMTEDTYNRIYQVVIHKESKRLILLQSTFVCNN